ncbi:MAG TPA: hypothetical protein VKC89_01205 [Patescibacteria group bacterium]|nr:hypothetical protein [Patescibacteria group bacterium]
MEREQDVVKDASQRTGFIPTKLLQRSSWWTSKEIGAFHYLGNYKGKEAVLKIQGIKPETSEIYMINSFTKVNKSKILRPPHLYSNLPWDNERRYEALILEYVNGKRIVSTPTEQSEVDRFFDLYQNYKKNCLNNPWIDKPDETISQKIEKNFSKWREASFKLYPSHPLKEEGDINLIDEAVKILIREYENIEPQFQHPHLTENDLMQVGAEVIVGSNLYWGWRAPLYDAIFGYHWFKYHLSSVLDIASNKVQQQIDLWLSKIESLPEVKENQKLFKLAMLERYAAGLNLDALSVDLKSPAAKYLVEFTRREAENLISELS